MAQEFEFTGKTVEEAVLEGLQQLGLTKETANVTVLEEGGKGLIFKSKAKVLISKKESDTGRVIKFIEALFGKMDITATAEVVSEGEKVEINLIAANSSALIGYRGEVLDSIQTLAGAVYNMGKEDYVRVVVDCENYRGRREETLKNLANKLADKAVRYGKKMALEPMNPYERRIIHSALAENADVKTTSEGKEPNRYVVVIPNELKPQKERFDRDRKFGDRKDRGERKFGERRDGDRPRPSRPAKKASSFSSFEGFGGFIGNSLKETNGEGTPLKDED